MTNKSMPPTLLEAGWYLSYMNYAATGEGLTSCLAVAGTAEAAERILKEKLPEYFLPLYKVVEAAVVLALMAGGCFAQFVQAEHLCMLIAKNSRVLWKSKTS